MDKLLDCKNILIVIAINFILCNTDDSDKMPKAPLKVWMNKYCHQFI